MKHAFQVASLLSLLCLFPAGPAGATLIVPADFAGMVAESQLIVHGRIVDVRGVLAGSRRTIESVVTVEVIEPLKGQPGRDIVFRVPGGTVGRYRRVFVGAPTFTAGDEVVLFLKGQPPGMPMPFGLSQGVYRVSRVTGSPVVTPAPEVAGVAGAVRGDPVRRPLALAEFARQVRTAGGSAR